MQMAIWLGKAADLVPVILIRRILIEGWLYEAPYGLGGLFQFASGNIFNLLDYLNTLTP